MKAEPTARARDIGETRNRIATHLVGRELELTLAAIAAGRDMVLEGPPGTSKTTMLRAITLEWGIPLLFVEGNADVTPAKLVGHHNPARVLREDYSADNFVAGPLVEAMQSGGFLYIEEFNRAPEDTLNTLLTAMADRCIAVPRVGSIAAMPTFRVIASMNPYDNMGTTRLSTSVHDRLNRLSIEYQDEDAECGIVALRSQATGPLVDVSGSMKGERLHTAAAAVGALTSELHRDALAVIAFWSDAALLLPLGGKLKPLELLDTLLQLPARGLTNVGFPLKLAARELARSPARDSRVLLLSDCVHNAGPDPRVAAARLPRLDVLIDVSGETDLELGRELALLGRGSTHPISTYRAAAPALGRVFHS